MKKEQYEALRLESEKLQKRLKTLIEGCDDLVEKKDLHEKDEKEVRELGRTLYDFGDDTSEQIDQLEEVENIDNVSGEQETAWMKMLDEYRGRLHDYEEHYNAILQRIHRQKYSTVIQEKEEETYLSQSGRRYTIDEIVESVKSRGDFFDFKSNDQNVYKLIRLFSSEDIENLLAYPEIKTAFMNRPNFEVILEYASSISEETINDMYDLAQASEIMEDPFTRNEVIAEVMSSALVVLDDRLNCDEEEAARDRFALSMLTSFKHPVTLQDIKPLTNYSSARSAYYGLLDDLKEFRKGKCGAGFHIAFSKLYRLVKSYNEIQKVLDKQAELSPKAGLPPKV